jgi:hypothetical protein
MVIPISYYILLKKSRGWGKFEEKNLEGNSERKTSPE